MKERSEKEADLAEKENLMTKKVIVDTPVWIDHLIQPVQPLVQLLRDDRVVVHEDVLGELACGNFRNRREQLRNLSILDRVPRVQTEEVISFIENQKLHGLGPGWIDLNLLATALVGGYLILTSDKKLQQLAVRFEVNAEGT